MPDIFIRCLVGAFLSPLLAITARGAGDVELGRYLASECQTCHRQDARTAAIPNIYGISPAIFVEVMKAYRASELANPVMRTVAGRLKDDEIDALAAYFSMTKRR